MKLYEKNYNSRLLFIMLAFFALSGIDISGKMCNDPVDKLRKTGKKSGKDFIGNDLRSKLENRIKNPEMVFYVKKKVKWILWFFGKNVNVYKVTLHGSDLRGKNLSGLDLSEVNLSDAICDGKTDFTESVFSKGTSFKGAYLVISGDMANLENIKDLDKAKVDDAIFNVSQIEKYFVKTPHENGCWFVIGNMNKLKKQYHFKIDQRREYDN